MSVLPAIPTPYIHSSIKRRKNTWYSISDGYWSNPNTWMSNGLRRLGNYPGQAIPNPVFPQVGDDVYINNNVKADVSVIVNNLRVSGDLTFANSISISVNGDIQATGIVDMSGVTNPQLLLYGGNNFITTFICGTSGTVTYARNDGYNQWIMDLSYRHLKAINVGTKFIQVNTNIAGTLTTDINSVLELSTFNLTVNGITNINNYSIISKTGSGSLLFVGKFNTNYGINSFTGNPSIEFRGGFNLVVNIASDIFGTGTMSFTTNNQSLDVAGGVLQLDNINVVGAIVVTQNNHGNGPIQINNYIDGTVAGSKFVVAGVLQINTTTTHMATAGVFDWMTNSTSMLGYVMNGDYTLPYTTYQSLFTAGTGTKYLSGNTVISGNAQSNGLAGLGNFNLSGYNFTVNGTTYLSNDSTFTASTGNILFVGLFSIAGSGYTLDFSSNPTVEFRGGMSINSGNTITGSPTFKFTTNSQTLSINNIFSFGSANILISGAITVTSTSLGTQVLTGTLNGDNANSIFDNRGSGSFNYKNAAAPMVTGKLYCNQAANTFIYGLAGGQDIQVPSDPTPGYKNLTLNGSGAKRLLGNVSVKGTYVLTSPATLNSNGYSLTNP